VRCRKTFAVEEDDKLWHHMVSRFAEGDRRPEHRTLGCALPLGTRPTRTPSVPGQAVKIARAKDNIIRTTSITVNAVLCRRYVR
jgi:hypothetical protein